jgi:hypothetical protein
VSWTHNMGRTGAPIAPASCWASQRTVAKVWSRGWPFVPGGPVCGEGDGAVPGFGVDQERNSVRNSDTIFEMYGRYAPRIDELVAEANVELESSRADSTLAGQQ